VILAGLFDYFLLIQTAVPALFVAWCLINDWRKNRIVHPVFALGGAVILISWPLRGMLGQTDAWAAVAAKIAHLMS